MPLKLRHIPEITMYRESQVYVCVTLRNWFDRVLIVLIQLYKVINSLLTYSPVDFHTL